MRKANRSLVSDKMTEHLILLGQVVANVTQALRGVDERLSVKYKKVRASHVRIDSFSSKHSDALS
jgi:hypothetical protein